MTFDEFMKKVDANLSRWYGIVSADIDDYCYRDAYEDGESPVRTASLAAKALDE
jgi:hypothetical protein